MRIATSLISLGLVAVLHGVDDQSFTHPRLSAQVLLGTAGFEPGLAAEWLLNERDMAICARPEVFINQDGKVGGGLSLGWRVNWNTIPDGHELYIGPRVVYHNADDYGWEGSAEGIYSIPLFGVKGPHYVQIIGTAGIIEKMHEHDDSKAVFGGSVGAAYAYRF